MATTTDEQFDGTHRSGGRLYIDAAAAGVAAGIVFGLVIQFALGRMTTIGALFTLGEESLAVGWVAHLVNSTVFALVYATVTRMDPLSGYVDAPTTGPLAGAGYGAGLWFVNIGFIWPLWLNAVGVGSLPVPYLATLGPLAGHLLWGLLLGGLFPLLARR